MNILEGIIIDLKATSPIHLIKLNICGKIFKVITLELFKNLNRKKKAKIIFKETEVVISKKYRFDISFENQILSEITNIIRGEILSEITLDTKCGIIKSLMLTEMLDNMMLKQNENVYALVKATDISMESSCFDT